MSDTTKNDSRRKSIGKHLQALRKAAGFSSASAFANSIGINPNTYTQYEQGLSGFSYERAWYMADALNVSLDELGGRKYPDDKTPPLSPDELSLVDSYRLMDDEQRNKYRDLAPTFVVASEKDDPGKADDVARAGKDVTNRWT